MEKRTRRELIMAAAGAGAGLALAKSAAAGVLGGLNSAPAAGSAISGAYSASATDTGAMELKAAPMEKVRVAFIGLGARGGGHLGQMMQLEGVEIAALCDNYESTLNNAAKRVEKAGRPVPPLFGKSDTDYKRMLERKDIDMVIIATPWQWHTPMCLDTMKSGKHAFTEVPAALTVEECWDLVITSEKTQKHCMMMENCCYGQEELALLNMCRLGVFGDLLHGEAAYIHDLRSQMNEVQHGTGSWRTFHYAKRNGNLYPTHGLGPVAQYMSINRGDRFDYLSSVASPALGRALYAKAKYPADHQWNKIEKWNCGDIVTTIIKTACGRSLMVQWDETSPRPYTRINLIQGTKGCFAGYPPRLVIEGETKSTHEWTEKEALKPIMEKYDHPLWKKLSEKSKSGGHGGMDFVMLWRVVYCLRNGEPLDQNVYDAAAWSAIGPLSEESIAKRSASMDVPDFTKGRWKTAKPLGIVS